MPAPAAQRPHRRLLRAPLLLLLSTLAPIAAGADQSVVFQLQADGLLGFRTAPQYPVAVEDASPYLPNAPGFAVSASFRLGRRYYLMGRAGGFRSIIESKTSDAYGAAAGSYRVRAPRRPVAGKIERKLNAIPIHAVLQHRGPLGRWIGIYDEIGVGITTFTEKNLVSIRTGPDSHPSWAPIGTVAAHQKSFSVLLGGGAFYAIGHTLDVVVGANYLHPIDGGGKIWRPGEAPGILLATVGIRYPHE